MFGLFFAPLRVVDPLIYSDRSTTIKTDAEFSRVLDVKYQPRSANICVTALGTHGATAAREGTFNVTPIGAFVGVCAYPFTAVS